MCYAHQVFVWCKCAMSQGVNASEDGMSNLLFLLGELIAPGLSVTGSGGWRQFPSQEFDNSEDYCTTFYDSLSEVLLCYQKRNILGVTRHEKAAF